MPHKHEWEQIQHDDLSGVLKRTGIKGGWLVSLTSNEPESIAHASITFVPDPDHKWDLSIDYTIKH